MFVYLFFLFMKERIASFTLFMYWFIYMNVLLLFCNWQELGFFFISQVTCKSPNGYKYKNVLHFSTHKDPLLPHRKIPVGYSHPPPPPKNKIKLGNKFFFKFSVFFIMYFVGFIKTNAVLLQKKRRFFSAETSLS